MGSPTIFSGKYTKLLTQKGLMQQGGAVNQFDGDRNYIKNSTFEANILDGWNRVKTTITSNLPTGTPTIGQSLATAPSIASFYINGGSAPFDSYALYFGNPITTVVAGEGIISDAFTVEPGDLGKVLTFKLYYKSEYGASTDNWSGVLGSQTWAVYIYDQTAGAWLQPAGFLGMNQNSGVGIVSGTFQSSVVSGQQYRIAVIALKNTTSTSALQIDNIYFGSQTAPIGPVMTDFQGYAPATSGFNAGTSANINVRWRRVGDSIHLFGTFVAGGTGIGVSGDMTIFLPSGLSFDTTKIGTGVAVGAGEIHNSGLYRYGCSVLISSSNAFVLSARANAATGGNIVGGAIPEASWWNASGDQFSFELMAPISGWSSNVQISNDTDTRVVAAAYFRSTAQSIPAATDTTVIYDTRRIDTHAAMNTSNGRFYAPVSGVYRISASVFYNFFVPAAGNPLQMRFLKRNAAGTIVEDAYKDTVAANAAVGQEFALRASSLFSCNAGETLEVVLWQNTGAARTTIGNINFVEIERLSGPSVVAASETVAVIARKNTGAQTTSGSVQTVSGWLTPDVNTHGTSAFNPTTGIFTAPISGTYQFSGNITFGINGTGYRSCYLSKNSPTSVYAFGNFLKADASVRMSVQVNSLVYLNAGETCMLVAYQDAGGSVGYSTLNEDNHISIVRVGN